MEAGGRLCYVMRAELTVGQLNHVLCS